MQDGPAFISNQYNWLDASVVPVVKPFWDILLHVSRHVGVTVVQKVKHHLSIWN